MKQHKISLISAILININLMVGAGIFINPPLMAQKAGSMSFLGWTLSALIFLPVVISIARIARIFPGEGGSYLYSKKTFGRTTGFLSGWVYFLGYVAVQSMQTLALRETLIYNVGLHSIKAHPILFNATFFATLCMLCMFNLNVIARIQNSITILKLIPIVLMCLFVPFLIFEMGAAPAQAVVTSRDSMSSLLNVHVTLPLALFGFWGFECCTSISHLISGDKRNASRAILIGFLAVVTICTIFHYGLVALMGAENLSTLGVPAFSRFLPITSPSLMYLTSVLLTGTIVAAYASAIYGALSTQSFLLNAMAREKLLFFSETIGMRNKHNQPIVAVCVQGFIAFLFVTLINHTTILLGIANLGVIASFYFTLTSLGSIQLQRGDHGGLLMTVFGFIGSTTLAYYSWQEIGNVMYLLPFLTITLLGIVMFKMHKVHS